MTLKTGRKCTWEEIEVGEVFAFDGCFEIWYKKSNDRAIFLDTDESFLTPIGSKRNGESLLSTSACPIPPFKGMTSEFLITNSSMSHFYKLPKSVQRLWKEE